MLNNHVPLVHAPRTPFYRKSRMGEIVEDRRGSVSASSKYISTPFGKEYF